MNSLSAPSATTHTMQDRAPVPWWLSMLLCGMAGGMGWGIHGQYGHESGAMMAGLLFYCGVIRRDRLALRLGIAGLIGGALGFPGGQCFQANHAWNAEWYRSGFFATLDPHMNWWNMMEISFGTIMGATLGLIVWMNRHLIHVRSLSPPVQSFLVDGTLLLIHLPLLSLSEFAGIPWIDALYGIGFCMGVIPLAASVTSRWWPFFVTMPVLVVPIAGKTVRELVYKTATIAAVPGLLLYVIVERFKLRIVRPSPLKRRWWASDYRSWSWSLFFTDVGSRGGLVSTVRLNSHVIAKMMQDRFNGSGFLNHTARSDLADMLT